MKILTRITGWATGIIACMTLISLTASGQSTPKLTDPEIASVAVTANQIDVNYGKLAIRKSTNSSVKDFAHSMVKDHENIIQQAVALAGKLGVTPKDNAVTKSLLDGEKTTMAKLNKLKGSAFDKAYIDNEVAYHEAVIDAVKNILIPQTNNAELKDMLVKVAPLLEEHLKMAKMAQSKIK